MSIEAMKQARDWIAERPDLRPISAGKMISIIDRAIEQAEKQEPVAWMCHPFGDTEVEFSPHQECENCTPLYTTPPAAQRQWVGLTADELDEVDAPLRERGSATIAEIYRAIEAKLRSKNGGAM